MEPCIWEQASRLLAKKNQSSTLMPPGADQRPISSETVATLSMDCKLRDARSVLLFPTQSAEDIQQEFNGAASCLLATCVDGEQDGIRLAIRLAGKCETINGLTNSVHRTEQNEKGLCAVQTSRHAAKGEQKSQRPLLGLSSSHSESACSKVTFDCLDPLLSSFSKREEALIQKAFIFGLSDGFKDAGLRQQVLCFHKFKKGIADENEESSTGESGSGLKRKRAFGKTVILEDSRHEGGVSNAGNECSASVTLQTKKFRPRELQPHVTADDVLSAPLSPQAFSDDRGDCFLWSRHSPTTPFSPLRFENDLPDEDFSALKPLAFLPPQAHVPFAALSNTDETNNDEGSECAVSNHGRLAYGTDWTYGLVVMDEDSLFNELMCFH